MSLQCKIPIEVAEEYWSNIKDKLTYYYKIKQLCINYKSSIITSLFTLITVTICASIFLTAENKTRVDTPTTYYNYPIISPKISGEKTINSVINKDSNNAAIIVYTTKYGKKYHKRDCSHIQNSNQLFEFSIEDAVNNGYQACKDCF